MSPEPFSVPTRSSARLTLRPLTPGDEGEYVRILVESAAAWEPWSPAAPPSLSPVERFGIELERAAKGAADGTHLRLAAFLADGELVGSFALNEIVRGVFHNAYAGWQVAAGRMGQGLATEGVRLLLDIAFGSPPDGVGLHRVQANVMPGNAASIRLAERVGFRREGLAKRYLRIAGRWEDHVMFALTVEEWSSEVVDEG